jgi:threonine aldolase
MTNRLGEDHENARRLAEGLSQNPRLRLTFGMPQTNMVFADLVDDLNLSAIEIAERLHRENIRVGVVGPRSFRMVTHYWIKQADIDRTLEVFMKIF